MKFILAFILLSLISCDGAYYYEAEGYIDSSSYYSPTYEVCETVIVTEYETIENHCAETITEYDRSYCLTLIDEFMYNYPEVHCTVASDYYMYSGLELNLIYFEDYRNRYSNY